MAAGQPEAGTVAQRIKMFELKQHEQWVREEQASSPPIAARQRASSPVADNSAAGTIHSAAALHVVYPSSPSASGSIDAAGDAAQTAVDSVEASTSLQLVGSVADATGDGASDGLQASSYATMVGTEPSDILLLASDAADAVDACASDVLTASSGAAASADEPGASDTTTSDSEDNGQLEIAAANVTGCPAEARAASHDSGSARSMERSNALARDALAFWPAPQHGGRAKTQPDSQLASQTSELLLHFQGCWPGLTPNARAQFAPALRLFATLSHLDLRRLRLGLDGAEQLARALPALPHLRHLDIASNDLGPGGCEVLAGALPFCTFLEYFNAGSNRIDEASWARLATALAQGQVAPHTLLLPHNKMTLRSNNDGTLQRLLQHVRCLGLSACAIDAQGVSQLVAALQRNTCLDLLDLERNPLGCTGAQELAEGLPGLSVCHLNVRSCRIGRVGVAALVSGQRACGRSVRIDLAQIDA